MLSVLYRQKAAYEARLTCADATSRGGPQGESFTDHRMWGRMKGMERAIELVDGLVCGTLTLGDFAAANDLPVRCEGARKQTGIEVLY